LSIAPSLKRIGIDSQKEFNASVDASLFFAKFREKPGWECSVADSFEGPVKSRFGWHGEKFVADINQYEQTSSFDGQICNGLTVYWSILKGNVTVKHLFGLHNKRSRRDGRKHEVG